MLKCNMELGIQDPTIYDLSPQDTGVYQQGNSKLQHFENHTNTMELDIDNTFDESLEQHAPNVEGFSPEIEEVIQNTFGIFSGKSTVSKIIQAPREEVDEGIVLGWFNAQNKVMALTESLNDFPPQKFVSTLVHEQIHAADPRLNKELYNQILFSPEKFEEFEFVDSKLNEWIDFKLENGVYLTGYEAYHFDRFRAGVNYLNELEQFGEISPTQKEMYLHELNLELKAEVLAINIEQFLLNPEKVKQLDAAYESRGFGEGKLTEFIELQLAFMLDDSEYLKLDDLGNLVVNNLVFGNKLDEMRDGYKQMTNRLAEIRNEQGHGQITYSGGASVISVSPIRQSVIPSEIKNVIDAKSIKEIFSLLKSSNLKFTEILKKLRNLFPHLSFREITKILGLKDFDFAEA